MNKTRPPQIKAKLTAYVSMLAYTIYNYFVYEATLYPF